MRVFFLPDLQLLERNYSITYLKHYVIIASCPDYIPLGTRLIAGNCSCRAHNEPLPIHQRTQPPAHGRTS